MKQQDSHPERLGPCCVDFIGNQPVSPPENVTLVESDKDYVRACLLLSKQLGSNEGVKTWVRARNHFLWLQDFTAQIGLPCLFREQTVKQVLAEQWNVSVPDWLDDAQIVEQGLLDVKVVAFPHRSLVDRILAHFLGEEFREASLDSGKLASIVNSLATAKASEALGKYPALRKSLKTKCEEWSANSPQPWVVAICDRIPEDFEKLWRNLGAWSVLHGYPPEFLDYVLPPQDAWVRKIPPGELAGLDLETAVREEALTQVDLFFESIKPQVESSEDFRKALQCVSGRFTREFDHVSDLVKGGQFMATIEDLKEVEEKFRSCPGATSSRLALLKRSVKPPRPALPEPDEARSPAEWVRWTVDEYAPYRAWQTYSQHYDEDIEKMVRRFSGWYVEEYLSVHKELDLSLIFALNAVGAPEAAKELTVVLLVDCLPLQFAGLLEDSFRNHGFSLADRAWRFAPLPTTTVPNKAMLLGGEWDSRDKSYESVLKTREQRDWSGRKAIYASNLKNLAELGPMNNPTIVVLNLTGSDDLMHEDVELKNTTHEEELSRLFERLARTVGGLCATWPGKAEDISVHVVTDHGACQILEEEKRSFDSALVNKLFPNEKHRFSSVDAAKEAEVPENLWDLGYKFKQPFHSDGKIYFLPKGHNTVRLPGGGKGFVHGGATPEEVIVPTVLFKRVKTGWKHPLVRFLGLNMDKETGRARFYVQRVVPLTVEIRNPNSSALRVVKTSVLAPDTDLKSSETPSVEPGKTASLRLDCYFKKSASGPGELLIEIAYEIGGERCCVKVPLECLFKSAVTSGFSLKEL